MLNLSLRLLDNIGSFCDASTLHQFQQSSLGVNWVFTARMKMQLYLSDPVRREREIGESDGLTIVYAKATGRPTLVKITDQVFLSYVAETVDIERPLALGNIHILLPELRRGAILVGALEGSNTHSGTGTALMQAAAMEYGCTDGNQYNLGVTLRAIRFSYGFYWNLGMRTGDSVVNEYLAKNMALLRKQGLKHLNIDIGLHCMSLPAAAANMWKTRIRQDPILYTTREEVGRLKLIKYTLPVKFSRLVQDYLNPYLAYD